MNQDSVLSLFRESGALLEGHFKLSSGLHSGGYPNVLSGCSSTTCGGTRSRAREMLGH